MKRILTLSAGLLLFISTKAQDASKLLGTWAIQDFQYSNGANPGTNNNVLRKYKTYTPTNFIVTEIDNRSNITTTSIFGTYEIKDGVYTENIISVNRESAGMIGAKFSFKLSFEGDDKMKSVGSFNGMETSELWVRVKSGGETDLLLQGKGPSIIENAVKEVKIPHFVIKTGDKYIHLKSEDKTEMLLKHIDQNEIATIEVVKNQTALNLFGDAGKNGVVILGLKEGRLEAVLEKLKTNGVSVVE